MPHISIVSPVFRAEKIIAELVRRIENSVSEITQDYEIILVEDGGPDASWNVIESLANLNSRVKGVKLSRNFGQHHAITCGLDLAKGDWIVVMDCDLQDQPEAIKNLYEKAQEGYEIVFASRKNRTDSFLKKAYSKFFYLVFSKLSGIHQDGTIGNFGIYSKKVVATLNTMREPMRAFSPMVRWVGFSKTVLDVPHSKRFEGKTSYSFSKLINLALDIAVAYSDKPLRLTIKLGFFIAFSAFLFAVISILRYYMGFILISGYTSVIVSIWFFSGLIIFILGIFGLYLSKIFDGIKNRPLYIVECSTLEQKD